MTYPPPDRTIGSIYECCYCGSLYKARRRNHYFCSERTDGIECRFAFWQAQHPRRSTEPKPRPDWKDKARYYYSNDEDHAWLKAEARRRETTQSALVREALELLRAQQKETT